MENRKMWEKEKKKRKRDESGTDDDLRGRG